MSAWIGDVILSLPVNAQELLTAVIALGGCLGTIALLIVNLKVSGAMSDLRTDLANQRAESAVAMAKLQVEMANLRADSASDRANIYEKIMENMGRLYIPREAQEQMHRSNVTRLDELKNELHSLATRVGDIS